ncbi:VOC family protein [Paenibacillus lutrae]|uniref:VOC domain-containing protein n=1 Tax=Paenibacillus lutrae TaxID=2078573 RepID=A0A7X3JYZ6_9BACL|nr:hypothetical protein [Paenibacillus lutrae]MVO99542.1 hypothetical protein [Paenibacillus lutrae]
MDLLSRIDCNFIPVGNILESIDWYVNKLGCKFMWHDGGYAALNVTVHHPKEGQGNIVLGQAMITLVQADEVRPLYFTFDGRKHPIINFFTQDIMYTCQTFRDKGIDVSEVKEYGTLKSLEFIDNNGHLMGVCSF